MYPFRVQVPGRDWTTGEVVPEELCWAASYGEATTLMVERIRDPNILIILNNVQTRGSCQAFQLPYKALDHLTPHMYIPDAVVQVGANLLRTELT